MKHSVQQEGDFNYIETSGSEETLILLHGLFGALSNFEGLLDHFSERYNVVVPMLPLYTLPLRKVSITGLLKHLEQFVAYKGYKRFHILGNSLGGHLALLYTLAHQEQVKSLTLTGSSGLFENGMGSTFPKRGNYDFIQKKTADTFYDPTIATKELVDEVFDIVNSRHKAMRVVVTAKSAIRHNVGDRLHEILVPSLLIWGRQDTITPHYVGEKFQELLPNAELFLIDKCGHAPMMEHNERFNEILEGFLERVCETTNVK